MTNGHIAVVAVLAGLVAGYLAPWLTYWNILGWKRLAEIRQEPGKRDQQWNVDAELEKATSAPERFTITKHPYTGTGDHTTGVPFPLEGPPTCDWCGKPRQRPFITFNGQFLCDECSFLCDTRGTK